MVQVPSKRLQFTFNLAEQSETEASATRALSIDLPNSATPTSASVAAANFQTTYMTTFANASIGGASEEDPVGSLIQISGWRDNDSNESALKCIGVDAVYIDETRYYFNQE